MNKLLNMPRWGWLALAAGLAGVVGGVVVLTSEDTGILVREVCAQKLDRGALEQSLKVGTRYMVNQQYPEGNFVYEYDWVTRKLTDGDNQVRQAGALWGLALIYQNSPDPKVAEAVERAMAFFARSSKTLPSGAIYPVYPGSGRGELGTVALVTLAYIDFLRAAPGHIPEERVAQHRKQLDGLLAFLLTLQDETGLFHSYFKVEDGAAYGDPNPYGDGESMLALAKMARYLGREDLRPALAKAVAEGYRRHIVEARKKDKDSDETKGFYQWSSMAFYEATTTGWPEFAAYGDYVIELAEWMIDTHRVLSRQRNTAYAMEGILHALALAERKGDAARAARFRCVAGQGLEKLTSWQVGGPMPNGFIQQRGPAEEKVVGGIQNHRGEPALRIDVTQHQMHAVILALRWAFPSTVARQ